MRAGFSLVELSIVLVILGLLTGGVLTGQSLIRAAELRSVTTDFTRYQTAVMTFKDSYFALPGDMSNATDFWGAATCPGVAANARTDKATCNGNGDGKIEMYAVSANEAFNLWHHLSNADLIEGQYTGVTAHASTYGDNDAIIGSNVPSSKISNAGWSALYHGSVDISDTFEIDGAYGNTLLIGAHTANSIPVTPILIPEEAWNIDKKIDDGKAGSGTIVSKENHTSCFNLSDGSTGSSSNSATRQDVVYNLAETGVSCALYFRNAF